MHIDEHFEGQDAGQDTCNNAEDHRVSEGLRLTQHVEACCANFCTSHYNHEHRVVVVIEGHYKVLFPILALMMST